MKKFFAPTKADGNYGANVRMEDVADNVAYAAALKEHDADYVEEMLDGRGYIFLQVEGGMITYQQDSL